MRGGDGSVRELAIVVPAADRRTLTEPGILLHGLGFAFWQPPQPVIVGELTPGEPAAAAGLAVGDVIIEVAGHPIGNFTDFVAEIRARPDQLTEIVALRDGLRRSFSLVPKRVVEGDETFGRIGLGASASAAREFPGWMHTVERYGPLAAVGPAVRETWQKSALTLRFLWRMVTGDVSTKNISGPINIAQYAGISATAGFTYYVGFLALVSISLAVLNLLPVPVLDGGQIAFQLVEMAKGAPLSMQAQLLSQRLGIAMLVALMGIAFYNDITRLLG